MNIHATVRRFYRRNTTRRIWMSAWKCWIFGLLTSPGSTRLPLRTIPVATSLVSGISLLFLVPFFNDVCAGCIVRDTAGAGAPEDFWALCCVLGLELWLQKKNTKEITHIMVWFQSTGTLTSKKSGKFRNPICTYVTVITLFSKLSNRVTQRRFCHQ